MIKKIRFSSYFFIFIILVTPILGFVFKSLFLPEKYFYDYEKVLSLVNGLNVPSDKSFDFASSFFKNINIFNLSTLTQWSILLTLIGLVFIIILYKRHKCYSLLSALFIFMSLFLMEIYVFTIGKEFIQLLFFLMSIILLSLLRKKSYFFKSVLLLFLCLLEGLLFRSYYLLVGLLFFLLSCVFGYFFKPKSKNRPFKNKTRFLKVIILLLFVATLGLIAAKLLFPSFYSYVSSIRLSLNGSNSGDASDRVTMILDLIPGGEINPVIFLANILLNSIRFLFPVELLLKRNVLYVLFFIYQMVYDFFLISLVVHLNNANSSNKLIIALLLAYLFTLVVFEPDFGSLVRHECVCTPLIFVMIPFVERRRRIIRGEFFEN